MWKNRKRPPVRSCAALRSAAGNGPAAAEETALLSDAEYGFLGCLLDGGDWGTFARERSLLPSVLVDSINEKLFDRFGDTVIGYDAEKPEVIEDYREELRGMIRK